ncbi:1-phosphatidylinositol 4,5-bisphosphate phosphodiesterase delta-1-like isoform X2 [Varroa destructor]|uniref:Phosphoinositide phospholipase C n=1 Tax=Varroa destructor TaxID=109461 RepID=A0A7M7J0Y4_VARDE|nr:1-phosphatidylinositol 4,5-bisphosphate phosphodiesterase delta-1-like isoform X2 [Varroa destructor]
MDYLLFLAEGGIGVQNLGLADFPELLLVLERGTVLHKVVSASKVVTRRFYLDPSHEFLLYYPSHKGFFCMNKAPELAIRNIGEVRRGYSTDVFHKVDEHRRRRRTLRNLQVREELCFSIVLSSTNSTLNLIAPTMDTCVAWCRVLSHLVAAYRNAERQEAFDNWIKAQFTRADINANGVLNFSECLELLRQMNKAAPKKLVRKLFDAANKNRTRVDGKDVLDKEEFVLFYNSLLHRPEIQELFDKYKVRGSDLMGPDELQSFLKHEQCETHSLEECQELITTLTQDPNKDWGSGGHLSMHGFEAFLLSDRQAIFDYQHQFVCQDMTRPLNEYFIASSHNTYLLNHQLVGSSSVEGYIKALRRGCRCLELDVWDGQHNSGGPIIFHGYTLTSKILLKDVIEAIREYAFVASPYPVILSIENHCSQENQVVMARYFREILGDMLCAEAIGADEVQLPSPEQLKYKILIKGKKLPPLNQAACRETREREELLTVLPDYEMSGDLSDSSEISEQLGSASSNETDEDKKLFQVDDLDNSNGGSNNNSCNTFGEEKSSWIGAFSETKERNISLRRSLTRRASSKVGGGSRKHSALASELSDLINYIVATQFRSFEDTEKWNFNQMASFSETKYFKILSNEEGVQDLMRYTQKFLARIYPKSSRTSSTNYDPIPIFNVGCQIVALNYQTSDRSMFYNVAKFAQNGNCGYVLKPQILREGFNFNHPPACLRRILNIKIISGQHIPKPDEALEGEVVDPYVVLKIVGHPSDSYRAKTEFVKNNGFNPHWNKSFSFTINVPDLATLVFIVRDDSRTGKNQKLGKYAIPVSVIQGGYRHVHLRNAAFEKIVPATLFVHVSIGTCPQEELEYGS